MMNYVLLCAFLIYKDKNISTCIGREAIMYIRNSTILFYDSEIWGGAGKFKVPVVCSCHFVSATIEYVQMELASQKKYPKFKMM